MKQEYQKTAIKKKAMMRFWILTHYQFWNSRFNWLLYHVHYNYIRNGYITSIPNENTGQPKVVFLSFIIIRNLMTITL